MKSLNQKGNTALVTMAIIVVAAVGFAGYRVTRHTTTITPDSGLASTASQQPPTTITSTADLKKAGQALDNTTIDSSVDPNSLDSDLNSL